jgi:hypothetical protein
MTGPDSGGCEESSVAAPRESSNVSEGFTKCEKFLTILDVLILPFVLFL